VIVLERHNDAKTTKVADTRHLPESRQQTSYFGMLLRILFSETTIAAVGLMILVPLSYLEVNAIDIIWPVQSGWVMRLVRPFFSFALYGILTTTGTMIACLIAAAMNPSQGGSLVARNLIRFYLLLMFLVILIDLILHAAFGETLRRAYSQ